MAMRRHTFCGCFTIGDDEYSFEVEHRFNSEQSLMVIDEIKPTINGNLDLLWGDMIALPFVLNRLITFFPDCTITASVELPVSDFRQQYFVRVYMAAGFTVTGLEYVPVAFSAYQNERYTFKRSPK